MPWLCHPRRQRLIATSSPPERGAPSWRRLPSQCEVHKTAILRWGSWKSYTNGGLNGKSPINEHLSAIQVGNPNCQDWWWAPTLTKAATLLGLTINNGDWASLSALIPCTYRVIYSHMKTIMITTCLSCNNSTSRIYVAPSVPMIPWWRLSDRPRSSRWNLLFWQ